MKRLFAAIRLFLTVQARSYYLHVYLLVSIATVVAVRGLLPEDWRSIVVPAILLGEYGTMGVFMVGGLYYLGRIEGSAAALIVTPLRQGEHIAALILAPALVATPAGLLVHGGLLGFDARWLLVAAPLFLTACLAGASGLLLASRHSGFTGFLMAAIPTVTIFSLPYLAFFHLVPRFTFVWLPWDASLFSFANLAGPDPNLFTYGLRLLELGVFTALFFWLAGRELDLRRLEETA